MDNFKFLNENNNEIPFHEGSSWIFVGLDGLDDYDFDIITESHYGIHSFLNNFPNHFIVSVLSITGPDEIRHNHLTQGNGWGFDITRDLITIRWVRLRHRRI